MWHCIIGEHPDVVNDLRGERTNERTPAPKVYAKSYGCIPLARAGTMHKSLHSLTTALLQAKTFDNLGSFHGTALELPS